MEDPIVDDTVRTALHPDSNALVYKVRAGGTTYTSYARSTAPRPVPVPSASKASIDPLGVDAGSLGGHPATDFQLKSDARLGSGGTGTSLVADAASLTVRSLSVAGGLVLDASDPSTVTITGATAATLTDETAGTLPAMACSLIGPSSTAGIGRRPAVVRRRRCAPSAWPRGAGSASWSRRTPSPSRTRRPAGPA